MAASDRGKEETGKLAERLSSAMLKERWECSL